MSGCCAPTFGTAGPRLPEGRALTAPAPRAALPTQSRSMHARRFDPDATAKGANAARDETPHACRSLRPAPNPELPEKGRSGRLTPPPQVPRSRAETSATSAERRRTRAPEPVQSHTGTDTVESVDAQHNGMRAGRWASDP